MQKFKRGDVREDGMVYIGLNHKKPYWSTPEVLKNIKKSNLDSVNKQFSDKIGHARTIAHGRKKDAKNRGIEFSIEIKKLLKELPENCPVLNIPLSWGVRKGSKGNKENSPSLDRFDTTKGYVYGNVYWMSFKANTIKSNATTSEVEAVANWMKKINNG